MDIESMPVVVVAAFIVIVLGAQALDCNATDVRRKNYFACLQLTKDADKCEGVLKK